MVVTTLERLGRSTANILALTEQLKKRGTDLRVSRATSYRRMAEPDARQWIRPRQG